jgi:release factor glutamine methyltransferase
MGDPGVDETIRTPQDGWHDPGSIRVTGATVGQALRRGAVVLRSAGIENPAREARLLLASALVCSMTDLLRDPAAQLDLTLYEVLLGRRAAREPMAQIVGRQGFWSLDFLVSTATLIPRPDSETIVEAALALPSPARVLDLGTGTGCLLLSVLHERPAAFGVGVDLSLAAAALARRNADCLGLAARSAFLCGDWAEALNGRFDLILSNPPYIDGSAIAGLMPEIARYEPRLALNGGHDGLDCYRSIVRRLPALLAPGGAAVLELGIGQGSAVAALGRSAGLIARFRPDLAGIDRAIVLTRD